MKMKLGYEKNIEVLPSSNGGIQLFVEYMDPDRIKKNLVLYFDSIESAAFIAALTEAHKS
jgi:hypothetical protein